MRHRTRRSLGAAALVAALVVCTLLPVAAWAGSAKPLPAFMLEEVGTRKYLPMAETYKGKPTVFLLMTTNSTTCRRKADMLAPLSREFAGRVSFVMVSSDENAHQALPRLKELYSLPFTFLADPFFRFGKHYGRTYTPITLLTNAEGDLVLEQDGFKPEDEAALRSAIESLVK